MRRRRFLAGAIALGAAPRASAQPEAWPARPLRFVVPGAGGGVIDVVARQLAGRLAPALGQPVVVEARPGAGGILAMQQVARSAPDGTTFAVVTFAQLAVTPWMVDKPGYDPLRDFAPVALLFEGPVLFAVRADSPLRSWADLADAARRQPGALSYASPGIGQPPHVLAELVQRRAGLRLLHIPYKGGPAAVAGLLAGDVDLVSESVAALLPSIRAGRSRAFAITGQRRIAQLPDVPTFAEVGVPVTDNSWFGVVAPAGTPAAIIERMHRELARVVEDPELRVAWEDAGRVPLAGTPQSFARLIQDSVPRWRELVKGLGITAE